MGQMRAQSLPPACPKRRDSHGNLVVKWTAEARIATEAYKIEIGAGTKVGDSFPGGVVTEIGVGLVEDVADEATVEATVDESPPRAL